MNTIASLIPPGAIKLGLVLLVDDTGDESRAGVEIVAGVRVGLDVEDSQPVLADEIGRTVVQIERRALALPLRHIMTTIHSFIQRDMT